VRNDVLVTPSVDGTSQPALFSPRRMTLASLEIIGSLRIAVGERQLLPSAPQLFAGALYLCAESDRDTSREELQELLFGVTASKAARSHNLRQLLYRLTSIGFVLETRARLVRVPSQHVRSPLDGLRALAMNERVQLPAAAFIPLPGYSPSISRPFDDWLDRMRTRLQRSVRRLLQEDLAALRGMSDWHSAAMAARTLLALDPQNFSALRAMVEALLIEHKSAEALTSIDAFLEDFGDTDPRVRVEAQRLRRRVSSIRPSTALPPLIGRAATVGLLTDAWTEAERGETQYVLMTGPAGIGKSRLVSALRDLVTSRGATALVYSCGDNDRHRPLSFFVRLSTQLLALPGSLGISPSALSHITRLSLAEARADTSVSDAITSEIVRGDTHDALVDLIDAVSVETALLVVVDDAHLLDPSSWAVLRSLARRVRVRTAMLVLSARSTVHFQSQSSLPHCRVIPVTRLSKADSRALLLSLAPDRARDEQQLNEALRLAAGNPFFLQALARLPRWASSGADVPLDITALAARSYHSLDEPTRTVLECVLVLKDLSTLTRVCAAALVGDVAFLRSLRLLEEDGLVHCIGQDIRCSHDLLATALRQLIPSTVTALLRQRIAAQLEAECVGRGFDVSLAWAAADAWLSLGNTTAAARLVRRCGAHAAHLAEHSEAARMLCRLIAVPLPADEALALVDEVICYAEVGGERSILARALRERLRLMEAMSVTLDESRHQELSSMRIAIAEADLNEANDLRALISESRTVFEDNSLGSELRMRAGVSLLIAADLGLDRELAVRCWRRLARLGSELGAEHTQTLRGKLIYHTVFGSPRVAIRTARRILRLHPLPRIDAASVIARRNALFALQMLGDSATLKPTASATYALMTERKIFTEAVYVAVTLAEDAIAAGDFHSALDWLGRASTVIGRLHETAEGVIQGFMSALSLVAVHVGEYDTAARLLAQVHARLRLVTTPRLRAINATYLVRLAVRQGQPIPPECDVVQMREDYKAGCRLGRQDTVVEGLWLAYSKSGAVQDATILLQEYFAINRRETIAADWSLWNSSRIDRFWEEHPSLIPETPPHHDFPVETLGAIVSRCSSLLS